MKLLLIADFAVDTGFSVVAQNIIDRVCNKWDEISILAINYSGDPSPYQQKYKLYNPSNQGDLYGYNRVHNIVITENPDLIFMINDPWVVGRYLKSMGDLVKDYPIVAYMPIDGLNIKESFIQPLNVITHAVAYTEFAKTELSRAGLNTTMSVISHGVDTNKFYPLDKNECREYLHLKPDDFIVLSVDRNSPRKRIDLAIYYFSEWVKRYNLPANVKLYYHGSLRDFGWDIIQLADYFGIGDRLILTSPNITPDKGVSVEDLNKIYNAADLGISTSMGEGFGLTSIERMATRLPMILPDHSAFSEWAKDAAHFVECDDVFVNTGQLNTVVQVPSKLGYIDSLHKLYLDNDYRKYIADLGYTTALQAKFDWDVIAGNFQAVFESSMAKFNKEKEDKE